MPRGSGSFSAGENETEVTTKRSGESALITVPVKQKFERYFAAASVFFAISWSSFLSSFRAFLAFSNPTPNLCSSK
mgnify:CR=1 FL=1